MAEIKARTEGPGTEATADPATEPEPYDLRLGGVVPYNYPVPPVTRDRRAELDRRAREKPTTGFPPPKASVLTPRQAAKYGHGAGG